MIKVGHFVLVVFIVLISEFSNCQDIVIEDFESYSVGSNLNGQGSWYFEGNIQCDAQIVQEGVGFGKVARSVSCGGGNIHYRPFDFNFDTNQQSIIKHSGKISSGSGLNCHASTQLRNANEEYVIFGMVNLYLTETFTLHVNSHNVGEQLYNNGIPLSFDVWYDFKLEIDWGYEGDNGYGLANFYYKESSDSQWLLVESDIALGFSDPSTIDEIGVRLDGYNQRLGYVDNISYSTSCSALPDAVVFPSGSTTFCDGGFVQLTANSADSYLWSNGATTQTITVTETGEYTVTVFDGDGCSATSEPVEVVVNEVPSAAVNVSGTTDLCSGESVTLTAVGSGSYAWSNGLTSQSIQVDEVGSYSVTVTNNGCSATSQPVDVTVTPTPEAAIVPNGPTEFCDGGFVELVAQGDGSYQWNTGATTQNITVSEPGTYSVMVTNNGCSDLSALVTVTVNPLPIVSLSGPGDICENAQPVELSGGSPTGGAYSLNGEPSTEINPAEIGPGLQSVSYTYTDNNGCSNSAAGALMVNAVEPAELFGLSTSYLPGDGISELSAEPAGGVFGGTGVTGNVFDPNLAGPGTHNVSYAAVDNNGCISLTGACTTVESITGGQSNEGIDDYLSVYPNPSRGLFNVEISNLNGAASLSVIDSKGKVIFSEDFYSNGQRVMRIIDLSDFSNSIYILQLRTNEGVRVEKMVKK